MMKEITYSFVIPHHNTPDLLQRLVDSIPQREDIEVIVVDDNSDDDKRANINRLDVKTIYIDKEHTKGAGHARNVGMDAAAGKWLLFADADDFYKPNFIEVLDEYKNDDIEMLFFNVDSVDSVTLQSSERNRARSYQKLISNYDGSEDSINHLLFFTYGPWRRMLLREYVLRLGIRFEEICVTNDSFFSLQISYFAKRWKVEKRIIYTLTYTEGSLTYSKTTKQKYVTILNVFRRRAKLYKYMGHPEWNWKSYRGIISQSPLNYLYRLYKTQPFPIMLSASWYYLTHCYSIEKNAYYYVDLIKSIERSQTHEFKSKR